jgi:hypothetical protein
MTSTNYISNTTKCAFCDKPLVHYHEHHYPVAKCEGGTQTIRICPKCHIEYHSGNGDFKKWGSKGGQKTAANPENWKRNLKQFKGIEHGN